MDKEVRLEGKFLNFKTESRCCSGNLGNRWRFGHVTVRSNDPYQIAFEGIVGSSFQVGVAKALYIPHE
jgi:hypothetical protein